ncbi:relaxase/mobilization nuclease domain-containing protein [Hymenobacter monticola]|uniref:Relaxase/mobilization nuclease domain-containing protein n=1 Tax=Hymenobacter monticola TaxID=1705399 RepID=A0ABY4BET7_9BACT|nr:relaxase/mobilization nuclease domain-containing protein [Hymenobacter monticola]UOE36782.1 relaxase/mobilization nuclease domain-containing protein [Hymenobacter monticola]
MIGKVKIGKSFAGICRYVLQEDKQAQVLDAEGVRTDSAAHMAQDFEFQQAQRPGLGNAVLHVALALPAEDAAGRSREEVAELLRQIGRAYVAKMDGEGKQWSNTQWSLTGHFDKDHPHAHLVVNRVDNYGKTIPDNFIGQESRRVCKEIEAEMGLTVAEQRGREQAREVEKTHRQVTAKTPSARRDAEWQRARHEVGNALKHTAPYSGNWEELQAKLTRHGVQLYPSTHQKKDGPQVYGVVFEKEGHRFKGSEVAKEYSASKLHQAFAQYQAQGSGLAQNANQAAETYDAGRAKRQLEAAEKLNRQFQEQARQAQARDQARKDQEQEQARKAQEQVRQVTKAPQQPQIPDRPRDGGMEI